MKIISLSGPCGSGKSTIFSFLKEDYKILFTTYKNSRGVNLDATKLISKIEYVNNWFSEVQKLKETNFELILSDRSPFDSLAYLNEDIETFKEEIYYRFNRLNEKNITLHPILITASKNELKHRINNRFNSGLRKKDLCNQELLQLDSSLKFFEENFSFFEFIVETTNDTPNESLLKIKNIIEKINNS